MADLSIIGNYGQADAVGGCPFETHARKDRWAAQWALCIQAERQGLQRREHQGGPGSWSSSLRNA